MASSVRRAQTIQSALPIVAKAIGRSMKVDVQIGGDQACTDGETIVLPTLPFEDPDVEVLAFGFLEHEAAHVRYTTEVHPRTPLEHELWNTFEDIRIEKALGQEYPGFETNLKKLVGKLVSLGQLAAPGAEASAREKMGKYISFRLRNELLGQDALAEHARIAESICRATFPNSACIRIGAAIGRTAQLQTSEDALQLARAVVDIIEEEAQDPPPPPSPASEGEGHDAQGSDTANAPDQSQGEPSEGDPRDSDQASMGRDALREMLGDSQAPAPGTGELAGKALSEQAAEAVKRAGGGADIGRATTPLTEPALSPAAVLAEVASATCALRTRLRSFVESSRLSQVRYKRQGVRTDPRRFVKAVLGDPRVFKRKTLSKDINTAVTVLIDRSGSMSSSMRLALDAALACSSALDSIRGVSVMSCVFPGVDSDVEILTGFREQLAKTAHRHRGVEACGGTPMLEAMMWCASEFDARDEPRKMLFVFTDGEPPAAQRQGCIETVKRCWRGNVEVYGIGINVPGISEIFPVSRTIQRMEELAPAMFEVLQDAMTRPRAA